MRTIFIFRVALTLAVSTSSMFAQSFNWLPRQSPVRESLYAVTSGGGTYVAVGNHRTILTSRNGIDWTVRSRNRQSQGWFSDVAYGNGTFVVVGNGNQPEPVFGPPGSSGVSTNTNSSPIVISQDGIHWKAVRPGGRSLSAVTFGEKRFVAIGLEGKLTSRDGRNWIHPTNFFNPAGERINFEFSTNLTDIAHGNGRFVIVGLHGIILTSSNGLDWVDYTSLNPRTDTSFKTVTFNGSTFIASATTDSGDEKLLTSRNGRAWTEIEGPQFAVDGLGRGGQNVVAVGGDERNRHFIQSSADGLDWSGTPTRITGIPFAVGHAERGFVVVGANGLILQSMPRRPIPNSGAPLGSLTLRP